MSLLSLFDALELRRIICAEEELKDIASPMVLAISLGCVIFFHSSQYVLQTDCPPYP